MLAVLRENPASRTRRPSTPPFPDAGIAFTELGPVIDAIHTGLRPDRLCSVADAALDTGMITAGLCTEHSQPHPSEPVPLSACRKLFNPAVGPIPH